MALGDVELEQVLLLDALDLGHMLHLAAELTDVNLLDRDGFDGRAHACRSRHIMSWVGVLRRISASRMFLAGG